MYVLYYKVKCVYFVYIFYCIDEILIILDMVVCNVNLY